MEIKEILCMKEGKGEFSYARNSTVQGQLLPHVKPMIEHAIRSLLSNDTSCKVINVADLGCGVGPTPIALISMVIESVSKICKEFNLEEDKLPEVQIYMYDLPSNDFNLLFKNLRELQRDGMPLFFVMGAPGSFFNRLFTRNGLHLVHSNYALHWISQVPSSIYNEVGSSMNKGNIIVSEASPPSVVKAFRAQFQQDFSSFLKCRSNEIVNGYIILAVLGTSSIEPRLHWSAKILSQAITNLVSKGLITKEKAHSFAMPLHYPFKEEIQKIVIEEGSFTIEKTKTIVEDAAGEIKDIEVRAKTISKGICAAIEALVLHHFGEQIWIDLYDELQQATLDHLKIQSLQVYNIVLMLKKTV